MNQIVSIETMQAQPISRMDAEMRVRDLNRTRCNQKFHSLYIATKSIKTVIDFDSLPLSKLPNILLEQELEEDSFYVQRQKYTISKNGKKYDVHTLLTYVCHKDQDYLLTVAKEVETPEPTDSINDEYPIYNACLKELFKNIGVFCNTHKINNVSVVFNTFFFKKLLEQTYPETPSFLNKNYSFSTLFYLCNANNIVSNKGHYIAKNYLRHYKAIHNHNVFSQIFNIESGILHDLLNSYKPCDNLPVNFKQYYCDFLNKRHQIRLITKYHPLPVPTISGLMLTTKKERELYEQISQLLATHIVVHGKIIQINLPTKIISIKAWFDLNPMKTPTIIDLAEFIYKEQEKLLSCDKSSNSTKPPIKKPHSGKDFGKGLHKDSRNNQIKSSKRSKNPKTRPNPKANPSSKKTTNNVAKFKSKTK